MLYVATDFVLVRYNPSTDRWAQLTTTPGDMFEAGGGFVGGKFYLVGWESDTMHVYDPATNRWSVGPPLPTGRSCQPASITLQARLYLVECRDQADSSLALAFDPNLGSWSQFPMPSQTMTGTSITLTRVRVDGRPGLELVGGERPGNNWQYVP
jgi:hypothetical protein